MTTALELYYRSKAKKKAPPDVVKQRTASEVLGMQASLLKKKSPGLFMRLLDLLDRPGNATRALLVGKLGGLKGLIPFAQFVEDLTGLDIALNKKDRVPGTEVIETWFGKQKQRKGKIDLVDALGFLVEVVAEPLWLLGGGLTKTGKAAKAVESALGGIKRGVFAADDVKNIIKAAKLGTVMPAGVNKKMANAFRTIYAAGKKPTLARTWAKQVETGQRALFTVGLPGHRVPLIKGKPVVKGAEALATKLKATGLGKAFLAPSRRVPTQFRELHDIVVHHTRDMPSKERNRFLAEIQQLYDRMAGVGSKEEVNRKLLEFVEARYAGPRIKRFIADIKAHRVKAAQRKIVPLESKIKQLAKQKEHRKAHLKAAQVVPVREKPILQRVPKVSEIGVVPEIRGFRPKKKIKEIAPKQVVHPEDIATKDWLSLTGEPVRELKIRKAHRFAQAYEDRIASLRNEILRLKEVGTPKASRTIRALEKKLERMQKKQYVDMIKGQNRAILRKHTRLVEKDTAQVARRTAVAKTELRHIQKQIGQAENRIRYYQGLAGREDIKKIELAKVRRGELANEAQKIIDELPVEARAEFEKLGARFQGYGEEFLKTERAKGVPTTELGAWLGYIRRQVTPEARKFIAQEHIKKRIFGGIGREISPRHGSQRRRLKFLENMTREEIDKWFRSLGFTGEHFFEPGVAQSTLGRAQMHTRTVGAANAIEAAMNRFSKTGTYIEGMAKAGKPVGGNWMPVADFVERTGLIFPKTSVQGRMIPKEIADALLSTKELITSPEALNRFWGKITGIQKYMKGVLTLPFPAYHGRNALSNIFLNWIAGVKNPASYGMAAHLQRAALATKKVMKKQNLLWDDAVKQTLDMWPAIKLGTGKTVHGAQFWDIADQYGVVGRALGEFAAEEVAGGVAGLPAKMGRVKAHFKGRGKGWQAMRNVGGTVEDNARLAHFIEKTSQGIDPQAAAASVKRVLFDYGDLSPFEKKWMRDRVWLFYTFARKNLPLQIKTLYTQPAKQALFAHAVGGTPTIQGEGRTYPSYWQQHLIVKTPFRTKEGKPIRITSTGLPIEEAFGPLAGPGVGLRQRFQRIAGQTASRLAPHFKTPLEFTTGKNLYFDRPIRRWGQWGVQQTPASRFYGTFKSLATGRAPLGSRTTGTLTGLRYQPFDAEKMRERALRDIARMYLGKEEARVYQRFYLKEKKKAPPLVQFALGAQ